MTTFIKIFSERVIFRLYFLQREIERERERKNAKNGRGRERNDEGKTEKGSDSKTEIKKGREKREEKRNRRTEDETSYLNTGVDDDQNAKEKKETRRGPPTQLPWTINTNCIKAHLKDYNYYLAKKI